MFGREVSINTVIGNNFAWRSRHRSHEMNNGIVWFHVIGVVATRLLYVSVASANSATGASSLATVNINVGLIALRWQRWPAVNWSGASHEYVRIRDIKWSR